ncbi:Cof-type HAD-IIB family hydrolase [Bacillus solimangrovi]|uniref:Phosphatase n=1 Tax=Bacillus solimangrovi TaxID=1305675 RepID=A0A1E5LCC7_9BACI|nr:Cof-type HAD-IIB family hydrolase [Bacillus solimangrovi]OEH91649.1 phosphatase [Bacillus solimangrovi]
MKKQHLIALDLDGTLLTNEKTISDRTKQAIGNMISQGHIVMIATGRPYRSSKMYYNELLLNTPIVNFNGAHIHHPKDTGWGNFHTPLEHKTAKRIIQACDEFGIKNMIAEVQDRVFLHYHDKKIIDLFTMGSSQVKSGRLDLLLEESPTSLLIYPEAEKVDQIRTHLNDTHAELIEHRKWAAPWHVIEIVKSGLNKAVGIQKIAQHYNIPKERIVAFGDEDNDLEMLDYAGIGVAMDNAIDELKSLSNEITFSNNEHGVAAFLEKTFSLPAHK